MITENRKVGSKTYNLCLKNFKKQFKNVSKMTKIYLNSDNKVFAGEWIDSEGVMNFNSGFVPDAIKTINFID